jgi:hypothetical protein
MGTGLDTTSRQPRQRRPRRSEVPTERTPADLFMRRLLRLPLQAPPGSAQGARKAFQTSLLVATVRCLLMYVAFPFVLPALGLAKGVGPAIGLAINVVAMVCIVLSMRRFFRADHPKRWSYTALGATVLLFLVVLAVQDLVAVLT